MLPRTLWLSRGNPKRWREHRRPSGPHPLDPRAADAGRAGHRLLLHHLRQLPEPQVVPAVRDREEKYDRELHLIDQRAVLRQRARRRDARRCSAPVSRPTCCRYIYLWFLPLVPLAVTAWLVWSRNISLRLLVRDLAVHRVDASGTLSYYMLPTLGPGFAVPWLYEDVDPRRHADLGPDGLAVRRPGHGSPSEGVEGAVQSTAGFASLHVAITLLVALMIQYTINSRIVHWIVLGQLRAHHRRHPLLRLALHRRRRRRHPDRAARLLPRRQRQRAELRATRAGVAPHDDHLGGARRRRPH